MRRGPAGPSDSLVDDGGISHDRLDAAGPDTGARPVRQVTPGEAEVLHRPPDVGAGHPGEATAPAGSSATPSPLGSAKSLLAMTRCALYLRLSHDRPDETSTERQEADCRKLTEAKSWAVAAICKDLQSAWSDKARPDFERMLRDAESHGPSTWCLSGGSTAWPAACSPSSEPCAA